MNTPPGAVALREPIVDDDRDNGRAARLWVKTLSEFVTNHLPGDVDAQRLIPYGVQCARNLALAAAFERIERICQGDLSSSSPPPAAALGGLPMDSLPSVPRLEPSEN